MDQQENIGYGKSAAIVIVSLPVLSFTHQEGPAQGFLLLKGRFFLTTVACWGGGQSLCFCEAPGDSFDCTRGRMIKMD